LPDAAVSSKGRATPIWCGRRTVADRRAQSEWPPLPQDDQV